MQDLVLEYALIYYMGENMSMKNLKMSYSEFTLSLSFVASFLKAVEGILNKRRESLLLS